MTTTTHRAESIAAHALGVRHDPEPAGIFDDWHEHDLQCLRGQLAFLRDNAMEAATERRQLRFSRNHWRLASAVLLGLLVIAVVCR